MSIKVKTVPYDKENDALRARCTDLTNKLVTADSMAIALEMMLIGVLQAIDKANEANKCDENVGKWFEPVLDQDTIDWWAKSH